MQKWVNSELEEHTLLDRVTFASSNLAFCTKNSKLTIPKKKMDLFGIDYSHFKGQKWAKDIPSKNAFSKKEFFEKVLIINGSGWKSHQIKLKLYYFNLKKEKCEICGIKNWKNKKLSFHLDHMNGNHNDNRLENLRILCPNCHSQTDTFGIKNRKGSL
jgi:hypothetical protein